MRSLHSVSSPSFPKTEAIIFAILSTQQKIKKGKTRRNGKRIPKYEEDILIDQEMQLMQRAQREMAENNGDAAVANGNAKTGKKEKF